MAHLHSIYDNDAHFCIDPVTRRIKEDTSLKTLLAQGDHNSERFTFELPRIIEGHDMSLCDKVEIHYLNGTNPGVYEVDDLQISPNSDDVVIFSWLISNNATQLAAALAFAIKLACTTDGVVDYAYNTLPYEKVNVGKSINNGEVIIQEYADILAQWKQELYDAATNVEVDATLTVSGKPADAAVVGKKFSSLSEEIADISSGTDGKSAYQYAVEGGYTGTEAAFSEKLAQEQLAGTTDELTPAQVYEAVSAGIPVKVQYTDSTYGLISFTAFAVSESLNTIASNMIGYYNGVYILAELVGNESDNTWGTAFTTLAQKTDIPSALPNPNALTFTGAVTGSYDGSNAKTVNIPSAVTDDHINELINTALGVIENGSY